jgi:FkbM family methyltransferase
LVGSGVENPTILDLGGFIGTFVWFAMNKLNPKKVISVEPDPSNIEVYKKNWDGNPKVELIEGAVTMDDGAILPLYLGKTYRSCNSLEHFRGRQSVDVKTVSFKTLLDKYQPDIIKCDIEGGEFNLDWSDLLDCVKMITMEIHQQRPVWIEEMKTIDSELLAQGFEHVAKPKHELTFHKVDLATWRR